MEKKQQSNNRKTKHVFMMKKCFVKSKKRELYLSLLMLFVVKNVASQISFKTEYIGTSQYMHEVKPSFFGDSEKSKVGNSKGNSLIYQGKITLPLSIKFDENMNKTIWAINMDGSYVKLTNKNFTEDLVIPEIVNFSFGVFHTRPLNEKWSLMAILGASLHTKETNLSKISFNNTLINAGAIFIKKINPNFDFGGGAAINNTFGYPMIFPVIYVNWKTSKDNVAVNLSLLRGFELKVKYKANSYLDLSFISEMKGQSAFLIKDDKNMAFTHQYATIGLSPEIKLSKKLVIPLMVGLSTKRTAQFTERKFSSFFNGKNFYYFGIAPYFSVGLKYGFR